LLFKESRGRYAAQLELLFVDPGALASKPTLGAEKGRLFGQLGNAAPFRRHPP
jgi:hypothetical protein